MPSVNKIILIGNSTRDAEIRYIASGAAVSKFTLAVNRRNQKDPDFIDIIAWDKLAEIVNTHIKKGALCYVEGRLSIRSYTDKDGTRRKATEIVANNVLNLDKAPVNAAAHPAAAGEHEPGVDHDDDEVPIF